MTEKTDEKRIFSPQASPPFLPHTSVCPVSLAADSAPHPPPPPAETWGWEVLQARACSRGRSGCTALKREFYQRIGVHKLHSSKEIESIENSLEHLINPERFWKCWFSSLWDIKPHGPQSKKSFPSPVVILFLKWLPLRNTYCTVSSESALAHQPSHWNGALFT